MMEDLRFQDPGEGLHEAEVLEVLVAEGDRVTEGQLVFNVETDKAAFEVFSPRAGTVAKVRVSPGDRVTVGDALLSFAEDGERESPPGELAAAVRPAGEEARGTEAPRNAGTSAGPARPEPSPVGAAPEPSPPGPPRENGASSAARKPLGPVPATPATRRLARELGVDLREVVPSGEGGRVLDRDVRSHAEQRGPRRAREDGAAKLEPLPEGAPGLPDFSKWGEIERVDLRGVRRTTARRMAMAWSQVPHVNHEEAVDITELEALRQRSSPGVEARGGKLTLTVLVLRAAVATLREFPRFNASFDPEREQLIVKRYYRIGVAVDTERGLIVPVVPSPESKSLGELARELVELFERTRRGENRHDELTGGTFTLTNIGGIGGTRFTPIINYPEVAILGLARATLRATVQGDLASHQIVPRLILPLTLAFDHRVIDGAEAARFMARLRQRLSSAEEFLLAC